MHDIAVIGAGPYGLSIAAHLAAVGADFRIFGTPMQTWRTRMPRGMHLKSEGFASALYDPKGSYRLADHCAANGLPYADTGLPVPLETFSAYGLAFQRRFVPMLEDRQVVSLARDGGTFRVGLDDGQEASFRRVVCAVGITHFDHVASELGGLPTELVSHASRHADLSRFAGQDVLVVGAGASAADCAALLSQCGARVRMVTRRKRVEFHGPPRRRGLYERLRWPMTTIGGSWKSVAYTRAPLLFHAMPEAFRLRMTRTHLGPAPCWFVREQLERHVEIHTGLQITGTAEKSGRAVVTMAGARGPVSFEADHVVAATGYRVDLGRLGFLPAGMRDEIRSVQSTPILSRGFESSVPGLFFVGATSANSFGPLVRFACGAEFTAGRLTRGLMRTATSRAPTGKARMARQVAETV